VPAEVLIDPITNDEILSSNLIALSPFMVENFAWLPPQTFGVPHQSSPSLDHHFSVVTKNGASVLPCRVPT
jgi:hypothetical protein